jgi:hypothetical protein
MTNRISHHDIPHYGQFDIGHILYRTISDLSYITVRLKMTRAGHSLKIDKNFSRKKLLVPALTAGAFWTLALVSFALSGQAFALINFGYLGTALGVGLGLYAILPKPQKPVGRRVSLLLIGLYLFGFVGLMGRENIQMEGGVVEPDQRDVLCGRLALPGGQNCGAAAVWAALVRLGLLVGDGV